MSAGPQEHWAAFRHPGWLARHPHHQGTPGPARHVTAGMEGGRQGRHVLPSLRCECSLGTLRAAPPLGTTSTSTSRSTTTSTFASTHHQDKPADTPVHPSHPSTRQPHRVSSAPCHGWWRPWHGRQTNASPVVQSSPAGPVGAQMARPIISSSPSSSPPPIRIEKKKALCIIPLLSTNHCPERLLLLQKQRTGRCTCS